MIHAPFVDLSGSYPVQVANHTTLKIYYFTNGFSSIELDSFTSEQRACRHTENLKTTDNFTKLTD